MPTQKQPIPARLPDVNGIVLFLAACLIYFAGRAPFIGQWDSFDYLRQTVTHQLSALAFGRPVFIGCSILLWETFRRLLDLDPLQVENVVIMGEVLVGGIGVLLFRRLARKLLPSPLNRMATIAFLLSPMYAVYAGSVMTEVPMVVAVLAAANLLWESGKKYPEAGPLAGGLIFGLAIGIREQAATLGVACLWILWERRSDWRSRVRGSLLFCVSAGAAAAAPVIGLYLYDPGGFFARTDLWMHAIPTGGGHFVRNLESTLLFLPAVCPGAWLALLGATAAYGVVRVSRTFRREPANARPLQPAVCVSKVSHPVWGFVCGFVIPLAVLWRDADVQMHPRYLLILLPVSLLAGAAVYGRLLPSGRAVIGWAVVQLVVFGVSAAAMEPVRQIQYEKREFAGLLLKSVPDRGLLVSGGFSPVLEYYKGIGIRPRWRILWSGWGWTRSRVEAGLREAWSRHEPVYVCDAPWGWLMLEDERLDVYFAVKDCPKETVAPGITRIYPPDR